MQELLEKAFDNQNALQVDNVTSQSTDEVLLHPQRPQSVRQSEADELLAKEIFNQFQPAPTTPPMIDVPFDQSEVFDFNRNTTNSFLDALLSSTPEKTTTDNVVKETQQLLSDCTVSNPLATSCDNKEIDPSDNNLAKAPGSFTALTNNVTLVISNPTFDSSSALNGIQLTSENQPQTDLFTSKTFLKSVSSTPESSYFEILPKEPEITQVKTVRSKSDAEPAESVNNAGEDSPSHHSVYLSLSEQQQDSV